MKVLDCALLGVVLSASIAAETSFTISGEVLVDHEGVLYVHLVDKEQFAVPFTGIRERRVYISGDVAEIGRVPFLFADIPDGYYGIRVFIDTNGNGELDKGLFGPKEPWGMSWQVSKLFQIPKFKDIAFNLLDNMHGLVIDARKNPPPDRL